MYKLQKSHFKRIDEEKTKSKIAEQILNEWKLVNNRLEYIFLFFNVLTITTTPLILFGKYFLTDDDINNIYCNQKKCACEYSFIKNI